MCLACLTLPLNALPLTRCTSVPYTTVETDYVWRRIFLKFITFLINFFNFFSSIPISMINITPTRIEQELPNESFSLIRSSGHRFIGFKSSLYALIGIITFTMFHWTLKQKNWTTTKFSLPSEFKNVKVKHRWSWFSDRTSLKLNSNM